MLAFGAAAVAAALVAPVAVHVVLALHLAVAFLLHPHPIHGTTVRLFCFR